MLKKSSISLFIMKNLHKLNLKIYWADFILSSIIFAISFFYVYTASSIIGFIVSSIFLYRLCTFTHELAHQNKNPYIQKFKFVWNLTGGLLMFQPSLRFTKPHLKHHTTGIFATKDDPQYPLIYANFWLAAAIFIILPWFLPIYNLLVCSFPRFKPLENLLYKDIGFTLAERSEIESYELYYLVCFAFIAVLIPSIIIPFYFVSVGSWFLSVLRIPLEHPLTSYKKTSTSEDQKVLSWTHESPIYIPVQPLALRYHKAHHMFPKVPYHNLSDYHYELKRTNGYNPALLP